MPRYGAGLPQACGREPRERRLPARAFQRPAWEPERPPEVRLGIASGPRRAILPHIAAGRLGDGQALRVKLFTARGAGLGRDAGADGRGIPRRPESRMGAFRRQLGP